nr:putative ganglioside GM2 activator [Biomphalaria glabrata]
MEPLTDRLAGLRNKLQAKNDKSYDEFLSPLRWPFPSGELLKYTLEKCDPNTEIVKIDSLKLDPDPIPTKGEMTVYIDFTVDEDVNPPIKLDLEVSRREYGTWIAISCTGHVGSCTYDNVCPMLQNLCPADVAGELPCKCPLKKGNYKFSKKVSMKLKDYIAGSYQVVVKASNNEKNLACYKATFSIKRT